MAKRKFTSKARSRRNPEPSLHHRLRFEIQRERLFEALGIIEVCRHALASKLTTLDDGSVMDALKAAYRLVDDVASALEINASAASDLAEGAIAATDVEVS